MAFEEKKQLSVFPQKDKSLLPGCICVVHCHSSFSLFMYSQNDSVMLLSVFCVDHTICYRDACAY